MPRSRISEWNRSAVNHRLSSCVAKCVRINSTLRVATASLSGDEDVRRAEVAVVLRDLVLEDQVIAERVPRQLAGVAVVLMQVVPLVREDEVGRHLALQLLEPVLDAAAVVREVAVAEALDDDLRRGESGRERRPRSGGPLPPGPLCAEYDPVDRRPRTASPRAGAGCRRSRSRCRPHGRRSRARSRLRSPAPSQSARIT